MAVDTAVITQDVLQTFGHARYEAYRRLRLEAPLSRVGPDRWLVTSFALADAVLRDRRFGKDFLARSARLHGEAVIQAPCFRSFSRQMLVQDPPDHARLRNLVARCFTARRSEDLRPRIAAKAAALIDASLPARRLELVHGYAHPLSAHTICDLLGIPAELRGAFIGNARFSNRLIEPTPITPEELAKADHLHRYFEDFFGRLFEVKRAAPAEDIIGDLLRAAAEDGRLTSEDLVANAILLYTAGHETTAHLIGNGFLLLLADDRLRRHLTACPDDIKAFVAEIIRFDTSIQLSLRCALEDVELDGQLIRRGETVIVSLGAANRDPSVFDRPDTFDLQRAETRNLSFGGGIHHCLGAQLARIELEVAFATFLERLPAARFEVRDVVWHHSHSFHGLRQLPVAW